MRRSIRSRSVHLRFGSRVAQFPVQAICYLLGVLLLVSFPRNANSGRSSPPVFFVRNGLCLPSNEEDSSVLKLEGGFIQGNPFPLFQTRTEYFNHQAGEVW